MAASDARPFPIKNTAYRVYFPILDADGDLVSGAANLDSEISKDAGTFADCTNEATEIATSSGMYYLDLTATEMNVDAAVIIVKTSTSGAKTTTLVLYPVDTGDIDVDVTAWKGTAVPTPATAGYPVAILKVGTGTGEVNLASGRADANVTYMGGSALSVAAAQLGVNVVQVSGDAGAADNLEAALDGTTNLAVDAVKVSGSAATADALETAFAGGTLAVNAAQIGGSAAAATNAGQAFQGVVYGTAVTGTLLTTQTTTSLTGYSPGAFVGRVMTVYSGAKAQEQATITAYNPANGLLTHSALSGALTNGAKISIA